MEYVEGISVKNRDLLVKKGFDLKKIAIEGAWAIFLQVYEFGLFHGDLHPGNILITNDGKISYVNFGIVGCHDTSSREMIIDLFSIYGVAQDFIKEVYLRNISLTKILVASSWVLTYQGGYRVFGYNAMGLFGYVVALLLCLWVFHRIFIIERRKK